MKVTDSANNEASLNEKDLAIYSISVLYCNDDIDQRENLKARFPLVVNVIITHLRSGLKSSALFHY